MDYESYTNHFQISSFYGDGAYPLDLFHLVSAL